MAKTYDGSHVTPKKYADHINPLKFIEDEVSGALEAAEAKLILGECTAELVIGRTLEEALRGGPFSFFPFLRYKERKAQEMADHTTEAVVNPVNHIEWEAKRAQIRAIRNAAKHEEESPHGEF